MNTSLFGLGVLAVLVLCTGCVIDGEARNEKAIRLDDLDAVLPIFPGSTGWVQVPARESSAAPMQSKVLSSHQRPEPSGEIGDSLSITVQRRRYRPGRRPSDPSLDLLGLANAEMARRNLSASRPPRAAELCGALIWLHSQGDFHSAVVAARDAKGEPGTLVVTANTHDVTPTEAIAEALLRTLSGFVGADGIPLAACPDLDGAVGLAVDVLTADD